MPVPLAGLLPALGRPVSVRMIAGPHTVSSFRIGSRMSTEPVFNGDLVPKQAKVVEPFGGSRSVQLTSGEKPVLQDDVFE